MFHVLPCPVPGYTFQGFESWEAVRMAVRDGKSLYYRAPLDGGPRPIIVRKSFRNGKLRIVAGEVSFTADSGHLERFYIITRLHTSEGHADWPDFCQGARCGHLEGKGRAGSYVVGEEEELAYQAASANVPDEANRYLVAWAKGYSYGYRLSAEGSDLPKAIKEAPLPR